MTVIKQNPSMANKEHRDAVIIRTSVIGIIANVLLAAFKAFIGLASNSIAIVMDAVNNISDARYHYRRDKARRKRARQEASFRIWKDRISERDDNIGACSLRRGHCVYGIGKEDPSSGNT